MNRISIVVIALCFAIFCAGCSGIELYQNLSEEDANGILVLLSENGIKAKKKKEVRQNEVTYIIEVRDTEMARARQLLVQHNMPRKKEMGLPGVYKDKGLIPTPDEQKARYLLAVKGEIINSLERIPQIIDADVVLNVPVTDEFASADEKHRLRPTASVVLRINPDPTGQMELTEPKIQQFVSNAVEGMNPRDVTVILTYLPTGNRLPRSRDVKSLPAPSMDLPSVPREEGVEKPASITGGQELIGLKLDAESKGRLKVYLLAFFLILVVLSLALIVVIVQGSRMRRTLAALKGPAGNHPALEGQLLDEGPPELTDGYPEDDEEE